LGIVGNGGRRRRGTLPIELHLAFFILVNNRRGTHAPRCWFFAGSVGRLSICWRDSFSYDITPTAKNYTTVAAPSAALRATSTLAAKHWLRDDAHTHQETYAIAHHLLPQRCGVPLTWRTWHAPLRAYQSRIPIILHSTPCLVSYEQTFYLPAPHYLLR